MKKNRVATLSAGAILLMAIALPCASAVFGEEEQDLLNEPDKRWRRGPVQYLLTKEEDKQFKKLGSDEERREFIERFWERRDPTPGTEANEFKELFARRLELVQEKFGPPNGRGWEEDRGMVVLLLGPPKTVQISSGEGANGGAAPVAAAGPGGAVGPAGAPGAPPGGPSLRPRAVFVYEGEIFPGGPAPGELEFVGEGNGGFRLLTRMDFSDERLTGLEPLPVPEPPAEPPAAGEPAPPPAMEAEPPPPPPPPTPGGELLDQVLSASPPEPDMDVTTRLDFYKTREEDTFATLTVAVEDPGESPVVAARLLAEDGEVAASLDGEEAFTAAGDWSGGVAGTDTIFQGAYNLAPGTYQLIMAVKDPASGKVGVQRQEVHVPDYNSDDLLMSSVTMARKVEPAAGDEGPGERFVLGNYRVIPAPIPVFRPGQDLILYYQVYNTEDDPSSGKPRLKVTYKFAKVEANRKIPIRPITQDVDAAVQIFGITIAEQWPEGDYEVQVIVEDAVAGASVSSTVPFQVDKEG